MLTFTKTERLFPKLFLKISKTSLVQTNVDVFEIFILLDIIFKMLLLRVSF